MSLYKREAEALRKELAASKADVQHWKDEWIKAEQGKGPAMADSLKAQQLDKKLLVIGHIAAGRISEAIKEILEPMPVLFSMDVRFADDKTRIAAEDETLEKLKNLFIEAIKATKVKRAVQP